MAHHLILPVLGKKQLPNSYLMMKKCRYVVIYSVPLLFFFLFFFPVAYVNSEALELCWIKEI